MKSGTLPTGNVCWRADCLTVTLVGGTVYRWTTCDRDLTVGGNTYSRGVVLGRRERNAFLPEIASVDLSLASAYKIGSYTIERLATAGLLDDASVSIISLAGSYPGDVSGAGDPQTWRVASVEPTAGETKVRLASDVELLSNLKLPRFLWQSSCGHTVYDANCGLTRASWTVSGTVLGSPTPTTRTFAASGSGVTSKANDYFNLGTVAFGAATTTVALRNVRMSVADFVTSTDTFTLAMALPAAPVAGDTFTVYPGCTRTLAACTAFSNLSHYRGFAHIPTTEGGL